MTDPRVDLHFVEPRADGHRMQYVRRLIEAAPPSARLALSTFPSARRHPGTQAALVAAGDRLVLHEIAGEPAFERRVQGRDGFVLQPAYWRLFRRHWASLAPAARGDRVVVPYLDYAAYAIGALGSPFGATPFSGIVMRPDFHWPAQGVRAPAPRHPGLKRWLFLRLLRHPKLARLVTIDPSLRDWVAATTPPGHERLRYAEDPSDLRPAPPRDEARRRLGLRPDATVVLLYGSIDLRKGVASLLDLATSPQTPPNVQWLLVGRQAEPVRALIARRAPPAGSLVMVDRYVDRDDEALAFAAADLGWLAYEGFHGPSGVLAQCAQAGLGVIHRGEGLIGYRLRQSPPVPLPWLASSGLVASAAPAWEAGPSLSTIFDR